MLNLFLKFWKLLFFQIRRLMNKPISWVRVRDGHILSVDQTTFIADQRFQSIFKGENEYTWSLQIKYIQDTDEGWYECQVSTEPKMSAKVYLEVVGMLLETKKKSFQALNLIK